jgi:6-phosphogluconolactonase
LEEGGDTLPELRIAENEDKLAERAAEDIAYFIQEVVGRGEPFFHWALSGGRTSRKLYERLASPPYAGMIPWEKVRVFWGDERFVPSTHEDSNARMASEALLRNVPLPAANIFAPRMGLPTVEAAADQYERDLKYLFHVIPRFHLVLLGLGEDGHIASLFPKSAWLQEETRWVVPVKDAPKPPPERISFTLPLINNAEQVMFLITGEGKADVAKKVLNEPIGKFPAQYVWPTAGHVIWWLDRAAYPGGELS